MRIYIAARLEDRGRLRPFRDELWALSHEVVSSWLDEVAKPDGMPEEIFKKKLAMKDLAEIQSADLLVLDTTEENRRGGKNTEYGYALGQHQSKQIFIVGPLRNVFHYLRDRQFETWEDFLEHMRGQGEKEA